MASYRIDESRDPLDKKVQRVGAHPSAIAVKLDPSKRCS